MEQKENDWREFVRQERNRDPWGTVYKICRGRKKKSVKSAVKVDGRMTVGWDETMKVLLNEFFPGSMSQCESVDDNIRNDTGVKKFEWSEIRRVVDKMRSGKVPGLDGVTTEMVKRVWMAVPVHLKSLYDECLSKRVFPTAWKKGRVVILLKSPEKVRTDPRSYQPICLLPVFGKVLERRMVARLQLCICAKVRVNKRQYGFTEGKGVDDAWVPVKQSVGESRRKYVIGVFVDFQGAFDNLKWNVVLQRLNEIDYAELGIWMSYFRNRRVCVR